MDDGDIHLWLADFEKPLAFFISVFVTRWAYAQQQSEISL